MHFVTTFTPDNHKGRCMPFRCRGTVCTDTSSECKQTTGWEGKHHNTHHTLGPHNLLQGVFGYRGPTLTLQDGRYLDLNSVFSIIIHKDIQDWRHFLVAILLKMNIVMSRSEGRGYLDGVPQSPFCMKCLQSSPYHIRFHLETIRSGV
jgi:hypothetical protein